jgi:Tfp pilus assembly protein PilF
VLISEVKGQLGYVLLEQGNPAHAKKIFEECLVLDRELGDKYGICWLRPWSN